MLHPNINTILGVYKEGRQLRIVLELLERGSLFGVLHNSSIALRFKLKTEMVLQLARGLNYLHLSRPAVIHRDFKSPNLLVFNTHFYIEFITNFNTL